MEHLGQGFPELVPTLLKLELVKNVGCLTLCVAKLLLCLVSEMTGHVDSGFVGGVFFLGVSKKKGTYPKMDGV